MMLVDGFEMLQRALDMGALNIIKTEAYEALPDGEHVSVVISAFLSDVVVTDLARYFPQLEPEAPVA
jgi:hypothetical protein